MAPKERRQVYPAFWRKSANGQNSPAYGRENRVQLGGRTQLPAAVTDVIPDRVIAKSQSIRDLRGSPAQRDQPQHLQFPQGQHPGILRWRCHPGLSDRVGAPFPRTISCTAPATAADSSSSAESWNRCARRGPSSRTPETTMGVRASSFRWPDAQSMRSRIGLGDSPARRSRIEAHPSWHSGVNPPRASPERTS